MAITILQQPQKFTPVYNDMMFVVSSNNTAQTNFKYVADVYFPGETSYYTRLKLSARSDDGYGVFDLHGIIKSFVNTDISINSSETFKQNTNSYKAFIVQFGEEYGSTPAVYGNLATSGTIYAYNGIFDFIDFKDYNQTTFLLLSSTTRRFLTNAPSSQNIRSNEKAWLYMMTDTTAVAQIIINTYNSAGGLIQTVRATNPYGSLTSNDDRFLRMPCGPDNLNDLTGLVAGALPIYTASVASYDVQVLDGSLFGASEVFTFTIQDVCTKYPVYRFHFLNKLGGFDSFSFIRVSKQTVNIDRGRYRKTFGDISGSQWVYNKYDRGDVQFNTTLKDRLVVNSDWITEAESTWLEELITSPEVYVEDSDTLISVTITNSSYEVKQKVNEKLFNIAIEFEYSYNRYRQTF